MDDTEELEQRELWSAYLANKADPDLRRQLMTAYLPWVKSLANKAKGKLSIAVKFDDLVAGAMPGLSEAIDNFDPTRGIKFATFSQMRICGSMIDELRRIDPFSRLTREREKAYKAKCEQAESACGQPLNQQQLAEYFKTTEAEIAAEASKANADAPLSLDYVRGETEQGHRTFNSLDSIPDQAAERAESREEKKAFLRDITRGLSQNQRLILILYYYEGLKMKEIGETLNLCESRVSQMHKWLITDLRNKLKHRKEEFV